MKTIVRAVAAALLLATAFPSWAIFRAYLSAQGTDVNPCTLPAPCRLLPAALTAVDDGGEIWILDSANFNTAPVTVDKSVTILAVPGALASIVTAGGTAITVSGSGISVALRNLTLVNFGGGAHGIAFTLGKQLTVEECEIQGMPNRGVLVAGGARLAMRNSIVRDSTSVGIDVALPANVTLANVTLRNDHIGLSVLDAATVTIVDSALTDNSLYGAMAEAVGGGTGQLTIERSVVHGNLYGLVSNALNSFSRANVIARGNAITANTTAVLVSAPSGASAYATLEGNAVAHNAVGVQLTGGGVVTANTLGNNTFFFNTTSDVAGGTLTGFPAR